MYRSSPKALKEKDFDANKEMYPNYFGAGWMKVFVEKMSEFYSRLNRNKYTLIRHSTFMGLMINLILKIACIWSNNDQNFEK